MLIFSSEIVAFDLNSSKPPPSLSLGYFSYKASLKYSESLFLVRVQIYIGEVSSLL